MAEELANFAGCTTEGRGLLDPALTALGVSQAAALCRDLTTNTRFFDIVVTSPLTRAVQTARAIVASGASARVIVVSLHTENGVPVPGDAVAGTPCQRGRALGELKREFPDTAEWDWSRVDDAAQWTTDAALGAAGGYFNPTRVDGRLTLFASFVRELRAEHASVLVVGHSGFLTKFLGGEKMANCQVREKQI